MFPLSESERLYRLEITNPHRYPFIPLYLRHTCKRWLSAHTESIPSDFPGKNAYDLLGVPMTSSFSEIKASFRRLAKATHPDLCQFHNDPHRFVEILAAYEILSDSEKRAHYDRYLLSQRPIVQKHSENGSIIYKHESHGPKLKQMEVVEWLKWYRCAIHDILSEKRVVVGSGYFDVLERDFYSAIQAAYYGPDIDSLNLLPDRFEVEERSLYDTSEVLHLVSGRDLFGMVCIADKFPLLQDDILEKLICFKSSGSQLCHFIKSVSIQQNHIDDTKIPRMQAHSIEYHESDAYKNLELQIAGKVVAVATRIPPKSCHNGVENKDSEDHIHIYLNSYDYPTFACQGFSKDSFAEIGFRIPLGSITGLGTSADEGTCYVLDNNGTKTHVIMKHRTLLVKHMHWYQVGEKVSFCECRCSRAQLPPSRYWLFEPRCGMHDIGGWYVETFGRDKKGRTVPSQRYWDGLDPNEQLGKRLHPAMYLLAIAYRTLDIEDSKRRKLRVRDIVEAKMVKFLSWCKKLV